LVDLFENYKLLPQIQTVANLGHSHYISL